jgi:V/A-type H+/Na+-transporting ATPase subunit C
MTWSPGSESGAWGGDQDGERLRPASRDDFAYAYLVAQIRVLETRLLSRSQLLRLVDAQDADMALRMLGETEYAPAAAAAGSAADYEVALAAELSRVFALLRHSSPEPELVELLGMAYDWQNLKTVLKAAMTGKPVDSRYLIKAGNLDPQVLLAVGGGDGLSDPSGALASLPFEYRQGVARARAAFEATRDPQQLDLVLDAARFPSIIARARFWRFALLEALAQATADLTNLRTVVRMKLYGSRIETLAAALVPGGTISDSRLLALLPLSLDDIVAATGDTPYHAVLSAGVGAQKQSGSLASLEKLMDEYLL